MFQIIAAAACAVALVACGGGSGGGNAAVPPASGVQPPTTLKVDETVIGTGAEATAGKTVGVRYTGYLYDGTRSDLRGAKFDNNITAPAPFSFMLNSNPLQVITGFNNGVVGMKVGGKRVVTIPPAQGYGASANGSIPANATLIFEIELVSVN